MKSLLLTLTAIALASSGCDQRLSSDAAKEQGPPSTTPMQREPSPDDKEALQIMHKIMDGVWTTRGDSSFAIHDWGLYESTLVEAKGISLVHSAYDPPSQVDKLNGLEWRGEFHSEATVSRARTPISNQNWSPWRSGLEFAGSYIVKKQNGKWIVTPNGTIHYERVPSLDQIPK